MTDRPLGVLLTGGMGTRLRPLTPAVPKSLVPLLNRPLIAYGLDLLASMGLDELVVVTGGGDDRTGPAALACAPAGTTVTVAEQPEPKGSGDAVTSVGAALDGRHVVVLAVDTVLRGGDLRSQVEAFLHSGAAAWLPLHTTDRPTQMGIALLDGETITALEEKPEHPRSNLACIGLWMLAPEVIERLRTAPVSNPKEASDLTRTIAAMLAEGRPIGGRAFEGDWLDGGALSGLLAAQQALLAGIVPTPVAGTGNQVEGVVAAGAETHVSDSRLCGPVLLGDRVRIERAELGPDVVIGNGAVVRGARLERTLVSPGVTLDGGEYRDVIVTSTGEIVQVG